MTTRSSGPTGELMVRPWPCAWLARLALNTDAAVAVDSADGTTKAPDLWMQAITAVVMATAICRRRPTVVTPVRKEIGISCAGRNAKLAVPSCARLFFFMKTRLWQFQFFLFSTVLRGTCIHPYSTPGLSPNLCT